NTSVVITNLTYVNDPTVEIYSGGEGTYYEYGSPGAFQIHAAATDVITFTNITVRVYCNEQNSTEGGEMVWEDTPGTLSPPVEYDTQWSGGAAIPGGNPAGTYYYYAEVSMDYEGTTYSTVSEIKPVTYLPYTDLIGDNLEGSGTEEDPFLIKTLADLEYLQALVNRAGATPDMARPGATGYSFEGVCFRMEADITLPADWQPIGSTKPYRSNPGNGVNINPFSGTFDGGGHTITVAEGGKPLFGYVRGANVQNLNIYGANIAGDGLIDDYTVDYGSDGQSGTGIPATATIDHVTILSGSRIQGSGLLGGYASGQNIVMITNCTVQEDVIVGYEAPEDVEATGSIAGSFNGSISNCVSYATVNGINHVGGIVGDKGQSMGPFSVSDCEFYGTVNASGEYAGGIVGAGYISVSAPNAPCVDIENCIVNASVTGANYVGGVFGGEGGIVQAWQGDSNVGTIRNNEFRGTMTATAEDGIAGGVIGIMLSLNKNNVIENNYYASGCGAERGIGVVRIVDTDAMGQTPAWNEDHTVLYINTSADDISADDAAVKEIIPSSYMLVSERNDSRSDDPLGADAARLCHTDEPITFTDVTDETAFYYDPVYWAVDRGITTGWEESDGTYTFRPWNKCNRAAVITFLWRMAGKPEPQGEFTFSDATGNEDFDTAITWAV
ncbi:MAG: S-layer homology domain-containing protein, partial [Lachnospiraceae bacterium]|nr:S-layer homology domain-containing protein [Lachnospiraceae bacterium]